MVNLPQYIFKKISLIFYTFHSRWKQIYKINDASIHVAGVFNSDRLITIPSYGLLTKSQLDEFKSFGFGYISLDVIPNHLEGHIFCLNNNLNGGAIQLYVSYTGNVWLKRIYNWSSKTWTDWSEL